MSAVPKSTLAIPMQDSTFADFQRVVLRLTGIKLSQDQRSMIVTRFNRRLNALKIDSFEEYLAVVMTSGHPETTQFINTVTTNLTYFYREPHHFEALGNDILPQLAEKNVDGKDLRIWSAGCSSGQEPYSLAITAVENLDLKNTPVKILCTDIDSRMVEKTRIGKYSRNHLRGLNKEQIEKWLKPSGSNLWQADAALRSMLICKQMNLFGPWPVRAGVDVIMCRNVLIYFDANHQRKVLNGFASIQSPGSFLILGHSETFEGISQHYKRVANTVYLRI